MFGLLKATCPVEPAIRDWLDAEWAGLKRDLGLDLSSRPVLEPSDEYFPDPWRRDPASAQAMLVRLCGYMGVDASTVEVAFYQPDPATESPPMLARQGDRFLLPFDVTELASPAASAAVLARKLALLRLVLAGIDQAREDLPLLGDLATVALGAGVITANAAVPELPR